MLCSLYNVIYQYYLKFTEKNEKNGSQEGFGDSWLPIMGLISFQMMVGYSSGVITTSMRLPAPYSMRAKAAMLSGVWALTTSS